MNPAALSAIASPRRRKILHLVWENELSAGELAKSFDVSWPAVSQHLRVLKDADLIAERRHGRNRFYRTGPDQVGELAAVLQAMWSADLDRLAELAEAEHSGGSA
jgi:DNA-binding transcriptional ArsR family regulator